MDEVKKMESFLSVLNRNKISYILILVIILILASFGWFSNNMVNSLVEVVEIQEKQNTEQIKTRQFLLSTIDWKTSRQKKILFMRDQIIQRWDECGIKKPDYNKAYRIAETNMIESEKYPNLDALLVLAIEKVESAFNERAVSPMGASGIMQMMPSTGRLMALIFQVQYNDSLLFKIETNIKFGCRYLDVLYADFQDIETLLAGYNGGPYQAMYYIKDKNRLDTETQAYIPDVKNQYILYKKEYETFQVEKIMETDTTGTNISAIRTMVSKRIPTRKYRPRKVEVPIRVDSILTVDTTVNK